MFNDPYIDNWKTHRSFAQHCPFRFGNRQTLIIKTGHIKVDHSLAPSRFISSIDFFHILDEFDRVINTSHNIKMTSEFYFDSSLNRPVQGVFKIFWFQIEINEYNFDFYFHSFTEFC